MSDGIYVSWKTADVVLVCSKCDKDIRYFDIRYDHNIGRKLVEENNWRYSSKGFLLCSQCCQEIDSFWNKNSTQGKE